MEEDPGYPIWKDKSLERFIYDFVSRNMHTLADTFAKEANLDPNDVKISSEDVPLLTDWWSIISQECERALAIEKDQKSNIESISYWMKNLGSGEEKFRLIPLRRAPEDPTELINVQNELRELIQKSNIESISSWMKNLGSGEEMFRLIPLRRAPEDPMKLRNVQARRPNEIKKATKTYEERRKEIEVKVAAARFLQQKLDSLSLGNSEGDNNNNNTSSKDSASGSTSSAQPNAHHPGLPEPDPHDVSSCSKKGT